LVWRTAAQWQKTIFPTSKQFFFPSFAIALRFSIRKYRSCAQTWISVYSTFSCWEHIANSLGKIISQRSAFALRSSAPALAAGMPRQDHVYKPTDESFRFRNKKIDEIRCILDSTENPRSFEKYPTHLKKQKYGLKKKGFRVAGKFLRARRFWAFLLLHLHLCSFLLYLAG